MDRSKILLLPAVLIGFAAGWGAGQLGGGRRDSSSTHSAAADRDPTGPTQISGAPDSPDEAGAGSKRSVAAAPEVRPITMVQLKAELDRIGTFGLRGMDSMRQLADLTDRIRVSDPGALARQFAAAPPQPGGDLAWNLVMAAYGEKDPQGAWNFALGMKPGPARRTALVAALSTIASKNPTQALSMADTVDDEQLKRQVRMMAIGSIAQKDPRQALKIATRADGVSDGDFSMMIIFREWVQKDPEAAKLAAANLTGRAGDQARSSLVNSLAQGDPATAWDYATTLPKSGERHEDPKQQVIRVWAETDPQAALQAALSVADSGSRSQALSTAVSTWSRADFPGALQYAIGLDDSTMRSDVFRAMSGSVSENRQELLNAMIEHMPVGDNYQNAVSTLFSSWARENPAEAAAAIAQIPPGRALSQTTSQIASQWAQSGPPDQVMAWAQRLPEGEARNNALSSLFSQWSSRDPQQALRTLGTLSAADRPAALRSLAAGWSEKDPAAVLQWAGTLSEAGERNEVTRNALAEWAETSPELAAAYAQRLSGDQAGQAMQSVVDRWASKDAEAAGHWLSRQPNGPAKDSAISSLTRKIASEDPGAAMGWAGTISDPQARERQIETLARDWMRQDAVAARQWISTSSLPPDVRERLTKL
ncbi:MAG: hypothetical protein ACOYOL_04835 [Chthoniobacterales bacterium]